MARRARSRGFTLAELMVGLTVSGIVMTGVVAAFIAVQGSYQAETEVAITTENARTAASYIENAVRMAGYGLDPRVAFDVGAVPGGLSREDYTVSGFTYPATVTPTPAVVTDDLAFRYRDPAFLRRGTLSGTTLTLTAPVGVTIPAGKLLMVACAGGGSYTVGRVGASDVAATATSITVSTLAADIAPFVAVSDACLTQTGALAPYVMLVQEVRLRVINLGGRPWLVAFRNLNDNVTTSSNFDPIADDVETFQVAFRMNRPRAGVGCCQAQAAPDPGTNPGNQNWVVPDWPGEAVFAQPASVLSTKPAYDTGYDTADRFTAHPANIRAVQVGFVLRSRRVEPTRRRAFEQRAMFTWTPAGTPKPDGFYRTVMHTEVATPNLASRSFFVPNLRAAGDGRDLNTWGG